MHLISQRTDIGHYITTLTLCLALYGRDLDEEEEYEEEEEEQLEDDRLPDLLFLRAPQLLQYTAALHSRYDGGEDDSDADDDDGGIHTGDNEKELEIQRERRGELRLDSHIGTVNSNINETDLYIGSNQY